MSDFEWAVPTIGLTQASADLRYLRLIGGALTGLLDLSSASAGQVKFPASANLSADPNTLDAYAEGSWTPSASNLTVSGVLTLTGKYRRIGALVFFTLDITSTVNTSSTANTTTISGLPFASVQDVPIPAVNLSTVGALSTGLMSGTTVFPPSWSFIAHVGMSGCYLI